MLADAIRGYLRRRGLKPVDLSEGAEAPDVATISRVLGGVTRDPRLSTFLHICAILEVDPTELLAHAGLWPQTATPQEPVGGLHDRIAALPPDLRAVWTSYVESLLDAIEDLARRSRPPAPRV